MQVKFRIHLITKRKQMIPGLCPEMGQNRLTFPVRLEVAVDRGGLDLTPSAGASVHRKGCRRVAKRVQVMGPRAHGDVDTLGVITRTLHGQQARGTWIHGHVVVFGVGAVGTAYERFPWLGGKRDTAVTSKKRQEGVENLYTREDKS